MSPSPTRRYQYAAPGPLGGQPDTSWFNPYQPAATAPNTMLPPSSVPYYNGSDIAQQYVNNRNIEQNQGDMFQGYFANQAAQDFGASQAAGAKANQLYSQLEQTPGYTQAEQDAMLGNYDGGNSYQDLLNTDYNSNFLTPDEQSQIQGNPYDPMNQLHPEALTDTNSTAYNQNQGTIQGMQGSLNGNYDWLKSGLNNSLDLDQNSATGLKLSQPYQDTMNNVLTTTGNNVNAAVNNSGLDMSQEYARQGGMTDQEVADTASMAGEAAGANSRAAIQDLERNAAASGNASPLAVAAMRAQYQDQNAVSSADAAANAQLAARAQQRQAAQQVENTRLGAQQYKTGAQASAAENLGQFAANATTNTEQMRLGTSQDIANRETANAQTLYGANNQNIQNVANANLNNEQQWQQAQQQANEYSQGMGYNASANAEQQQSNRAGTVATNRQNTNQANQANQYNRGYQVQSTMSGLNQNIANQRITGQNNLRNYYTGQQQYQGQQGDIANQNMLTNRQQTQTGRNQATQGSAAWELGNKQYGFTSNLMKNLGGSLGSTIGSGGKASYSSQNGFGWGG